MGKRTAAPTRKRVGSKSVCVLRTRGNVASQLFLWKGELQGDVLRVHPVAQFCKDTAFMEDQQLRLLPSGLGLGGRSQQRGR